MIEEPILFIDAMHPTQAAKVNGGWIKTGHDKAIKTTSSRTRLNIVGALDINDIGSAVVNQYEKVNSETMQSFFETIRKQYPSKKAIHLILDGTGYHRAKDLKEKAVKLNIKRHYLPPYSPNLNLIERLWKVMNEHVRDNQHFATAKEFRDKIDEFFNQTVPKIDDTLGSRINDNFQVLDTA